MKKTTPIIDLALIAKRDVRCDEMARALLTRTDAAGQSSRRWPSMFQASGNKAGSKNVDMA